MNTIKKRIPYTKLENTPRPMATIERGLERNTKDDELWRLKGWAFRALNQAEAALAAFQQALDLNAENAMHHFAHAIILEDLNDNEGAIKAYDEAIKLDPNFFCCLQ